MGDNVHSTLADFLGIIPMEKRTTETIENLLRKKWRKNRQGFANREDERQWGEKALAELRWFVSTERVDVQPFMLEGFHEAPVAKDLILNGKIDRVDRLDDGSLHIIDYKTGSMPETVDSFQLLLYTLILSKTLGHPVSKASYLYLANGVWHTSSIAEGDVQGARDKVLEIAQEIELERDYLELAGPLCQFCDFLEICDAGREFRPTTKDAEAVDSFYDV